jgi:hypothetical protein
VPKRGPRTIIRQPTPTKVSAMVSLKLSLSRRPIWFTENAGFDALGAVRPLCGSRDLAPS